MTISMGIKDENGLLYIEIRVVDSSSNDYNGSNTNTYP